MLDAPTSYSMNAFRPLKSWYIGQVVANDDPKTIGSVKVEIPGLTRGIDKKYLPWYLCMMPAGLGGSTYSQTNFGVPQVNTQVVVVFPTEDLYSGIVIGNLINRVTFPNDKLDIGTDYIHPTASEHHFTENWDAAEGSTPDQKVFSPDLGDDYPFSHGWVDPAMNWFKVNMMKRSTEFVLNSFTKFKNYWNGDTVVHVTGNLKLVIEKDFYLEVRGNTDFIHFNSKYEHVIGNEVKMVEQMGTHEYKQGFKEQSPATVKN